MTKCDICDYTVEDNGYCYRTYYLINKIPVCRECAKHFPNRCPVCGDSDCKRHNACKYCGDPIPKGQYCCRRCFKICEQ